MILLNRIIFTLIFLIPISNSFGAMVTEVDTDQSISFLDGSADIPNGITFNPNGTKMFVSFQSDFINEYDLSTPFDISTHSYAGDGERCNLANGWSAEAYDEEPTETGDLTFSSDGLHIFIINRGLNNTDNDALWRYDLTKPFDVSTCTLAQEKDPDASEALNGWRLGSIGTNHKFHHAQGIAINPDGTKIFISFNGAGGGDASDKDGIREYSLSIPYDLSTLTHVDSAGILLTQGNPDAIFFSNNGKKIFVTDHDLFTVTQYSLSIAYDTSSNVKDGAVIIKNFITTKTANQIRALAFSANGLKMFVSDDNGDDSIHEFNLVCPFNIIEGKCPPISENAVRLGIAEAQVELAKRSISLSTNSALNRLKWIRRNKDKQNLSNQNIKLNFSNNMLSSLKNLPISTFKKASVKKNSDDSNRNYFYWSEGSISLGRIGDTSISSTKDLKTNSLTFGVDKFYDKKAISGVAIRLGFEDVDIGLGGSNLDSNTYNFTYYHTSHIKNNEKFLDTILGVGRIKSDILTVLDNKKLIASRTGEQVYGAVKMQDEYLHDNYTIIPYGQIDIGYTQLDDYQERGKGGINVDDQYIRTGNLRAGLTIIENEIDENYSIRGHGKLEYKADLFNTSSFKYSYVEDNSTSFIQTLETGALHNIIGEIGLDLILDDNYSIFIIYERDQAIGKGHTESIYVALGYLPYQNNEYRLSLKGSENFLSNLEIKKNLNGYDISFNLSDDLTNLGENREALLNLNKVF